MLSLLMLTVLAAPCDGANCQSLEAPTPIRTVLSVPVRVFVERQPVRSCGKAVLKRKPARRVLKAVLPPYPRKPIRSRLRCCNK